MELGEMDDSSAILKQCTTDGMFKCLFDDDFLSPPADPIEILNTGPFKPLLDDAITDTEVL